MRQFICIVCPKGCRITCNGDQITGYSCEKGLSYAKKELTNPTRMVTSTVKIAGAHYPRVPVKTSTDLPKPLVQQAVALLNDITVTSPVHIGDVVLPNVLGTGVDFIITKEM